MQIRETIDNPSTASTESPPEDVIMLVDSAGVALEVRRMKYSIEGALRREAQARPTLVLHRPDWGPTLVCHWQQSADGRPSCHWGIEVQPPPFLLKYAFSAKVRAVRPGCVSIASRWMEIPLVDGNGQISGVLCQSMPPSDVRGALVSRGRSEARAIEDVARLMIHEINNLLAVIGSGLQLLEGQSDSADRKVIVGKMMQAIARAALLSREFLKAARPCPDFMGGFVAGSSLAALAGTLDQALRPGITVRTEIAPDLWDFNADPEELPQLGRCYAQRRHDHRRGPERRPVGGRELEVH